MRSHVTRYPVAPRVFTVALATVAIYGRVFPYSGVRPGDIIQLTPGNRNRIVLKDFHGEGRRPIIIRNGDGLVNFNNSAEETAIAIMNCQHFRFTGSGSPSYTYGIKVSDGLTWGILFHYKTQYFEFDHLEFARLRSANNISIHGYTGNTDAPDYDYNGDGTIDANDGIINRSTHRDHNWHVHHCLMDGGAGTDYLHLAMYIGHSNWDTDNTPEVEVCHVHDNICQNIYHKVIQCGSIVTGLDVHHNTIINGATGGVFGVGEDPCAFSMGRGDQGAIHHNWLQDINGIGISFLGVAVNIYDNLIIRCGDPGTFYDAGIAWGPPAGTTGYMNVLNNTIIDAAGNGIEFSGDVGGDVVVQNNINVNPGDDYVYNAPVGATVDHNYETMVIADVEFTDEANDIYTLTAGSPARNAGADVSAYGVATDYAGLTRPKGAAYDEGAYEYDE